MIAGIAAFFGIAGRWQKVIGWLILLAGIAMAMLFVWLAASAWLDGERDDAVQIDRSATNAAVANQNAAAREKAAWEQQADELTRQRERQEIEEAINASERDPDGDPLRAAVEGVRR